MTEKTEVTAKKQVFFEAEPHQSIWFLASYVEPEGKRMIGTISSSRYSRVKNSPSPKKHFYMELKQTVYSNDNGRSWENGEILFDERDDFTGTKTMLHPIYFLDPNNGLLIELRGDAQLDCSGGKETWSGATNIRSRTFRMYYRFSDDGARSWSPLKQIIHKGRQFNADNWLPGVTYGRNSAAYGLSRFAVNADGEIVLPINKFVTFDNQRDIKYCDHGVSVVAGFLRGKWKNDLSDIEWETSEYLDCPKEERPSGICEGDIASLGGNRLFSSMRAMGTEDLGIPSVRMCSFSEDGGKSWSKPRQLTYDDGTTVWVPACPSEFIISPVTGRVYWIANIQEQPVFTAYPRSPLAIAEFDSERLFLIRDTVRVFWEKPEEMSPWNRRYSNWATYLDRETGEFVLTMGEEWKYSREDYTADAIGIRLQLREN